MIEVGIKSSAREFTEKMKVRPDFIEILLPDNAESLQYEQRIVQLLQIPWTGHLPTVIHENNEILLLNIASRSREIRQRSREIIEHSIQQLATINPPANWILHAPAQWNFSAGRKLFDKGDESHLNDGLEWISGLRGNVLLENVPDAIRWGGEVHFTQPYRIENHPSVIDTGHLYATTRSDEHFLREFTERSKSVTYYHVANLLHNAPFDSHGLVFTEQRECYPNPELLRSIVQSVTDHARNFRAKVRLVCEPGGDTTSHIENYHLLRSITDSSCGGR